MEKSIGLIGIGAWGKNLAKELHRQGLLRSVVASSKADTETWIAEQLPGIETVQTLRKLIADNAIKAVVIATPIDTHYEIASEALTAGKHVFLEKPGTDQGDKLEKLIAIAKEKNLIFQIGYEFVFSESLTILKQSIADKEIKSINFKWHKWGSFKAHPVINLLVHDISILKFLGCSNVSITGYKEIDGEHNPDAIIVKGKTGAIDITFDISIVSETKEKSVTIETADTTATWNDAGENLIGKELEAFVRSIETGTDPLPNGAFALDIHRTIEQITWKR